MSIVAVRNKGGIIQVAADSQVTLCDELIAYSSDFKKICRIKDMVIAAVGVCDEIDMFYRYVRANKTPIAKKNDVFNFMSEFYKRRDEHNTTLKGDNGISSSMYCMMFSGKIFMADQTFIVELKNNKFHAFGQGWQMALGVMEVGGTPFDAVRVVCKYNIYCGLPITTYEMPYAPR